jgi:hypothetical protein
MLKKLALRRVLLRVLRFPLSPVLHTNLHRHVAITRRRGGRSLGTMKQISGVSNIGENWIEKYFRVVPHALNSLIETAVDERTSYDGE